MDDTENPAINFRGIAEPEAGETWIRTAAPPGHPDYGGTWRSALAKDLPREGGLKFRLNSWSYEYPRFTEPFYYGRMFEALCCAYTEAQSAPG